VAQTRIAGTNVMKQNAVIILISFLVAGAAVVLAQLISTNGESKIPIASIPLGGDTEKPVTANPEQGKADTQAPAESSKLVAANPEQSKADTQAPAGSANLVKVNHEQGKGAPQAPADAGLAKLVAANPEQSKADPQASAESAKTEQPPQETAVNVLTERSATTTADPDKTAVLSQDPKAATTAKKPGEAEPQETLAPSRVSQVTEPTPPLVEKSATVHLVSDDAPRMDPSLYEAARWHPIHFKPAIDTATNAQCLACHGEVLTRKVRETSPAGVKAADSLAWYQTLDTYTGDQMTFHQRHMTSPFAQQVMNLQCNFCHQGHDLREEAPGSSATATSTQSAGFTLRKVVDPSKSCLLCHGKFSYEIMALGGPWHQVRGDLEDPQDPDLRNGCLTCHNMEGGFRTVRHQVSYLKADEIERLAKEGSSDTCYGCHGGRQWYRISNPYPRHPWPGMDPAVPDWAKDRPTQSDPRFALEKK
jgi:hypothetical protein